MFRSKTTSMLKYIIFIFSAFFVISGYAQLPEDFTDQLVSDNLDRPVGVQFDKSGNAYVWEQRGMVWIFDSTGQKKTPPLIDISEEVVAWKDHGLLGFTLDPHFENNGYIYLCYVVDRHHLLHFGTPSYDANFTIENQATIGRITRYTADPATGFTKVLPESRKILLGADKTNGFPILMTSHGIGTLVFGNDGSLLASCGDGGSFQANDHGSDEDSYYQQAIEDGIIRPEENVGSFRSILLNSLSGKIIRIDPETGNGMSDNPFYDVNNPQAPKSKVWAMGFRNPFRFIVQPNTGGHLYEKNAPGHLIIGDVGANLWEELSMATRGGQFFGWPMFEGFERKWDFYWTDDPNFDLPNPLYDGVNCTIEYIHFQDIVAEAMLNEPIFGNPCNEEVVIDYTPTFIHERPIIAWNNQQWNEGGGTFVGGYDSEGEGIAIDIMSPASRVDGHVFEGYSSSPGAFYTSDIFPESYHNALFTSDLYGWIKVLHFDENNQLQKAKPFANVIKGITDVSLNKRDGCIYYTNVYENQLRRICYGGNPPPVVIAKANKYYGPSPLTVEFDASESHSPFGAPLAYYWDFGDGNVATTLSPHHTFTAPNHKPVQYNCVLTVTDSVGNFRTASIIISVNNTPPQVEITSLKNGDFYSIDGITRFPLEANVMDTEHSDNELTYAWETFFHHNDHYHPEAADTQKITSTLIHPAGCELETFWYRIKLTVTDRHGLMGTDEIEIFPYCNDIDFEIAELTAQIQEDGVLLKWEIPEEIEIESYILERSTSEELLIPINIQATPNGNNGSYSFLDKNPVEGENFYRLQINQKDGIYAFSNTVEVVYRSGDQFFVYPNPARDFINIELLQAQSNSIDFRLFNSLGQEVFVQKFETSPNVFFENRIVLPKRLVSGIYYYQVRDGERQYARSIIIN